jgi:hypothetical protein
VLLYYRPRIRKYRKSGDYRRIAEIAVQSGNVIDFSLVVPLYMNRIGIITIRACEWLYIASLSNILIVVQNFEPIIAHVRLHPQT